ncbi:uncharacterized protein At3g28850-like [Cornus florida]|uniref:uncharacterized protein At3g28850-like n=1 Tax=Cornus florida TaxID=4283 RepID=UPI00289F3CA7|nr:uncharacterized protein At3g28850-like [Cornus florida]
MKGMKGRFLRKLKSVSTITTLKQGLVFHVNPSNPNFQTPPVLYKEQEHKNNHPDLNSSNICGSKALNDVKDAEIESGVDGESLRPPIKSKDVVPAQHKAEFGTALVSVEVQLLKESQAFEPIVLMEDSWCNEVNKLKSEEFATLSGFEEKCPPGGSESVILYTTSLRGIRKTFEDCSTIRFLLESFRIMFYERDVSMHLEFREELWRILGGRVVPPRLFIKGRHIGGADEVVGLHEQGKLKKLLQGIPLNPSNSPCNGCAGFRFVLCSNCSGSCRIIPDEQLNELSIRCPECNENGLVKCPVCC